MSPAVLPMHSPDPLCLLCVPQDFQRLLQDVNRTTMQAIQVYVDEVREHCP